MTSHSVDIDSVLAAFDTAGVVALGEHHGAQADSDFRIALIRDSRFVQLVNDVVIEFGSAQHQELLDCYIRGDQISADDVQCVWQDTTQPGAWDSPVYSEFLDTVREVNSTLRPSRRIRVWAGDPPIDWSKIRTSGDLQPFLDRREEYAVEIVERAILARSKKALLLYGSAHLYRDFNHNLVTLLEHRGAAVFVIIPLGGPDPAYAPFGCFHTQNLPTFVQIRGTAFANLDAAELLEKETKRLKVFQERRELASVFEVPTPLGKLVDACLYFGSEPPIIVHPDAAVIGDMQRQRELRRRRTLVLNPDASTRSCK